jgi:D-3-phosphoglycerate dehydrogenase
MCSLSVVQVAFDGQSVPAWATRALTESGIELVSRECRTRDEVIEVAGAADVVWVFGGSRIVTADCLPDLPNCWALLRTGTGTDNIPVAEATAAGIVVAITPEAGGDAVAEHTAALILAVLRQIGSQDRLVRAGIWDRDRAWPRRPLKGQTLGLFGLGSIARALLRRLQGFDLTVIAYDPYVGDDVFDEYAVTRCDSHEVLRTADIVSLHCPLTDETYRILGRNELRMMRPDAILVNTARGLLIDEDALYTALSEGWIGGAGLDVMAQEPPEPDNPILRLDNVVITPHIAAYSNAFWSESWRLSVETLVDLAGGKWPRFCANPEVIPRRGLSVDGRPMSARPTMLDVGGEA